MPLIFVVLVYKYCISPVMGPACRFQPSCSDYAITALKTHGPISGSILAVKRLLRCHPFSNRYGYDPVPSRDTSD